MFPTVRLEQLPVTGTAVFCPCCQSNNTKSEGKIPDSDVFAGRKLDYVLPGGELWICSDCRIRFRHPRLNDFEIAGLYQGGLADAWRYDAHRRPDWRMASSWIRESIAPNARVLDVGCSTGQFLSEILGGVYEKYGVEMNPGAAAKARDAGVGVVAAHLEEIYHEGHSKQFDVVTAFDVVEHVGKPREFVRMLGGLVRPGGHVIISTGNTEAWSWRFMGSSYWYCVFPEHISFVNPTWCESVAIGSGMRLSRVEHFSHSESSLYVQLRQCAANVVYRIFPLVFRYARLSGLGEKDVKSHPSLAEYPPSWTSARDHFIADFIRV